VSEAFGLGGLSMRDIQIMRGRHGGDDGVYRWLRWLNVFDRHKGLRHGECSLVLLFFGRFHDDANMRRRGMKEAQKPEVLTRCNIDA
jgi:hypothetical protein